jgi:hypothetical protein
MSDGEDDAPKLRIVHGEPADSPHGSVDELAVDEVGVDPSYVHVLVSDSGQVAIQWGWGAWYVLRNQPQKTVSGPHTRDELGASWRPRPHGPTLPEFNEESRTLLERCRWARTRNGGQPSGAWSKGEKLAVALVLRDNTTLGALDYSAQEAAHRLAAEAWTPDTGEEFVRWLDALRVEMAFPGFVTGTAAAPGGQA